MKGCGFESQSWSLCFPNLVLIYGSRRGIKNFWVVSPLWKTDLNLNFSKKINVLFSFMCEVNYWCVEREKSSAAVILASRLEDMALWAAPNFFLNLYYNNFLTKHTTSRNPNEYKSLVMPGKLPLVQWMLACR